MAGSLDATQAFLVYNLFYERIANNNQTVGFSDDKTIFGFIPLGKIVHVVLVLLFFFLFITQTCIDKDKSTIIFQLCTAALSLNLAFDSAEQELWVSATFYKWMHDIAVYFILTSCLETLGFNEVYSLFNVFKEKKRMLKHPKTDLMINAIFVFVSWMSSQYFLNPACHLFECLYTGYLLFRFHNYLQNYHISDMLKPWPIVNLNSSALTLMLTVLASEFSDIYLFLSTSITPDEIKQQMKAVYQNSNTMIHLSEIKANNYLCNFFALTVA